MKNILVLIVLLVSANLVLAQDFDSDSVHYTPVPKYSQRVRKGPYKIPKDTITEKQFIRYFFNVQSGTLIGCTDCSSWKEIMFSASTVHGVSVGKKIRTGAGLGIDVYDKWKTMPLFLAASFDVIGTRNKNAVFVQANYGYAFAWRRSGFIFMDGYKDAEGGAMMSAQLGYRIHYHDLNISISAGPKSQRTYTYYETPTFYFNGDGVMVQGEPNKITLRQDLNRFMISFALGWK